jgi:PKHD-type hydroxylase
MISTIGDVLSPEEIGQVREGLARASFVDGKATAGIYARDVKRNEQIGQRDPALAKLQALVIKALRRNGEFMRQARPKAIRSLLFSRYRPGMEYGRHVDSPMMGGARSDVSFTLFLNPPEEYEGGELVVESGQVEQRWKLPAGAMVLYPSTFLHRVDEVKAGERLVAAGWVRSLVRSAARRELLYEFETANKAIFARIGNAPEFQALNRSFTNLLRMWVED